MFRSRGGGLSMLTKKQLEDLKLKTHYSDKQLTKLLQRYHQLDPSEKGVHGISVADVSMVPEFRGNPMLPCLIQHYASQSDGRVHPLGFLDLCTLLSSQTTVATKRQVIFQCLDQHETGFLQLGEVFRLYKMLWHISLTDDQILGLATETLDHPGLSTQGRINERDFSRLVSDWEIKRRLTVNMQIP